MMQTRGSCFWRVERTISGFLARSCSLLPKEETRVFISIPEGPELPTSIQAHPWVSTSTGWTELRPTQSEGRLDGMSIERAFEIPDEVDLIEFFGAEPIQRVTEGGFWCYEVRDRRGIRVRFSFNLFERSVQTELSVGEVAIDTVSHELASRIQLHEGELHATFDSSNAKTMMVLGLIPSISLKWSTLRIR